MNRNMKMLAGLTATVGALALLTIGVVAGLVLQQTVFGGSRAAQAVSSAQQPPVAQDTGKLNRTPSALATPRATPDADSDGTQGNDGLDGTGGFGGNPNDLPAPQATPGSGPNGFGNGQGRPGGFGARLGASFQAIVDAAAKELGMTASELQSELRSGKSLNDIATEHNIDPQVLKAAILTGSHTALDAAVQNGAVTQEQADMAYSILSQLIDGLMSGSLNLPSFGGGGNRGLPGGPLNPGVPSTPGTSDGSTS